MKSHASNSASSGYRRVPTSPLSSQDELMQDADLERQQPHGDPSQRRHQHIYRHPHHPAFSASRMHGLTGTSSDTQRPMGRPPKQPTRTTKTSQKLVVLPEAAVATDDRNVTDVASEYDAGDDQDKEQLFYDAETIGRQFVKNYTYDAVKEREAERTRRTDRQLLARVTAYSTAKAYDMDKLRAFLEARRVSNSTSPKVIDECLYTTYTPPVSIIVGGRRGGAGGGGTYSPPLPSPYYAPAPARVQSAPLYGPSATISPQPHVSAPPVIGAQDATTGAAQEQRGRKTSSSRLPLPAGRTLSPGQLRRSSATRERTVSWDNSNREQQQPQWATGDNGPPIPAVMVAPDGNSQFRSPTKRESPTTPDMRPNNSGSPPFDPSSIAYPLKAIAEGTVPLAASPLHHAPASAPVTPIHSPPAGEIFFFDYGVTVFWGLSEAQELYVLSLLKQFELEKLEEDEIETEEFHYQYRPYSQPRIFNDIITLRTPRTLPSAEKLNEFEERAQPSTHAHDHMIKLTISHAIAQSVKLGLFEERIEDTIASTKHIPHVMAQTGKVAMSRTAIIKKIGQLFVMRIDVNLVSPILDTPEFFWSEPSLEYTAIRGYLEISQRVELLNQRCAVISDLLDMLKEHLNSTHGEVLEWIIIILIGIEIIIGLVTIAFDFANFYKDRGE